MAWRDLGDLERPEDVDLVGGHVVEERRALDQLAGTFGVEQRGRGAQRRCRSCSCRGRTWRSAPAAAATASAATCSSAAVCAAALLRDLQRLLGGQVRGARGLGQHADPLELGLGAGDQARRCGRPRPPRRPARTARRRSGCPSGWAAAGGRRARGWPCRRGPRRSGHRRPGVAERRGGPRPAGGNRGGAGSPVRKDGDRTCARSLGKRVARWAVKLRKSRSVTASHKGNTRHIRHTQSTSLSHRLLTERHVDIRVGKLERPVRAGPPNGGYDVGRSSSWVSWSSSAPPAIRRVSSSRVTSVLAKLPRLRPG